jgi:hypothetical protein
MSAACGDRAALLIRTMLPPPLFIVLPRVFARSGHRPPQIPMNFHLEPVVSAEDFWLDTCKWWTQSDCCQSSQMYVPELDRIVLRDASSKRPFASTATCRCDMGVKHYAVLTIQLAIHVFGCPRDQMCCARSPVAETGAVLLQTSAIAGPECLAHMHCVGKRF